MPGISEQQVGSWAGEMEACAGAWAKAISSLSDLSHGTESLGQRDRRPQAQAMALTKKALK